MTFIKFCGMTREQDVRAAADLGVDAVGFVFWSGSPRYLDVNRAAKLIAGLPATVTAVGVFVRPTREEIQRGRDAGIRVVQLHGVADITSEDGDHETWIAASLLGDGIAPVVSLDRTALLDSHDLQRHGGTGHTIDWTRAARVAATRRIILAGGLTPANVAAAIGEVHPYGVDVASGIEDRPGVKNARAMHDFVAAVRQADQ